MGVGRVPVHRVRQPHVARLALARRTVRGITLRLGVGRLLRQTCKPCSTMFEIEWRVQNLKQELTWCQALKYCALLSAMLCLSSVDMCAAAIRAARELQLRDPRPSPRRACNTSNHHHVVLCQPNYTEFVPTPKVTMNFRSKVFSVTIKLADGLWP